MPIKYFMFLPIQLKLIVTSRSEHKQSLYTYLLLAFKKKLKVKIYVNLFLTTIILISQQTSFNLKKFDDTSAHCLLIFNEKFALYFLLLKKINYFF